MSTNKNTAKKYYNNKKGGNKNGYSGKNNRNNNRNNNPSNTSQDPTTQVENPRHANLGHKNQGSWYYTDAEIAEQASRLSFQSMLGTQYPNNITRSVGTTCVLYWNPCPGFTRRIGKEGQKTLFDSKTGINLAAFKLFTRLSMRSGRTASYAPQDVAAMMLAMGEVISMIEFLRRYFGIAFTYNQRNRVWPKEIFSMLGLNPEDFFSNIANYRMRFNTIITRVRQIPIPANVSYFDKCEMLYQYVFLDDPTSSMAQTYIFMPHTTWMLDEAAEGGSALKTVDLSRRSRDDSNARVSHTMKEYLDILANMVDSLLQSSTLNTIYSDILNLATQSGQSIDLWHFDYVSEAYAVAPEYDADMLEIIHNTRQLGFSPWVNDEWDRSTSWYTPMNDVYSDPDDNALIYCPFMTEQMWPADVSDYSKFKDQILIDLADPNADLDTRLDIMQYKVAADVDTLDGNTSVYKFALPDHYCTYIMYFGSTNADHKSTNGFAGCIVSEVGGNAEDTPWNVFDWNPFQLKVTTGSSRVELVQYIGSDKNYFTYVDYDYMERLLNLSFMGLFDIR